jgi:hypothetical protein
MGFQLTEFVLEGFEQQIITTTERARRQFDPAAAVQRPVSPSKKCRASERRHMPVLQLCCGRWTCAADRFWLWGFLTERQQVIFVVKAQDISADRLQRQQLKFGDGTDRVFRLIVFAHEPHRPRSGTYVRQACAACHATSFPVDRTRTTHVLERANFHTGTCPQALELSTQPACTSPAQLHR